MPKFYEKRFFTFFSNMKSFIKFYIFTGIDRINLENIYFLSSFLPKERKTKFAKYVSDNDKKNCILAYFVLWYALKKNRFTSKPPIFYYGTNGKKYIKNSKNVYFNISHTKDAVICGLSDCEIGVDIEKIRDVNYNLILKVCAKQEYNLFFGRENINETFFKVWTRKESFCKRYGYSVFKNYKRILSNNLGDTKTYRLKEYVISITSRVCKNPKFIFFTEDDLDMLQQYVKYNKI